MTTAIAIRLPNLQQEITIAGEWIEQRDAALAVATGIAAVNTQEEFNAATEAQSLCSKVSGALEDRRLEMCRPFNDAAKLIKRKADEARAGLEAEKERIRALNSAWIRSDLIRKQKEAEAIERENQRRAAEAERENQRLREEAAAKQAEAEKLAAELGMVTETAPAPVAEVIPVEVVAAPVTTAKSASASVPMVLKWEYTDQEEVPRAFCIPDDHKVNSYSRDNKDRIKKLVKEGQQPIAGVRFWEDVDVRSR